MEKFINLFKQKQWKEKIMVVMVAVKKWNLLIGQVHAL